MKLAGRKFVAGEKGQALILVLVLMLIGGLITSSLLSYMSTGIKTGTVFQKKTEELYAADAGINDALWQVKSDLLGATVTGYDVYDYVTEWPLKSRWVNEKEVSITLKNTWVPDIDPASMGLGGEELEDIIQSMKLVVAGTVTSLQPGEEGYTIKISFSPEAGEGDELKIKSFGIWLPAGFSYVEGNSNLESEPGADYYSVPAVYPHAGGQAVVWSFHPALLFTDFPDNPDPADSPMTSEVTFNFTPIHPGSRPDAVAWITTEGVTNIPLSWDADTKIYRIISRAGTTEIEAYAAKNELRELSAAIAGDYRATGNTLMRDDNGDEHGKRERLYQETSASISDIPADAQVEAIYLYWSGWQNTPKDASKEEKEKMLVNSQINQANFQAEIEGTSFPGPLVVTADTSQVLANKGVGGQPHGWSYACYADVTNKQFDFGIPYGEKTIAEYFTDRGVTFDGNAKYSVGHSSVSDDGAYPLYEWKDSHLEETVATHTDYPLGSLGNTDGSQDQWAYAAWSLIVIYTSPETAGHQLYLYDDFLYAHNDTNIDFDHDDKPGGEMSGFLVPEQITGEVYAAQITCFVGEGDDRWDGDVLEFNGTPLSDDPGTKNTENVWNSWSVGLSEDGIDIDTFDITWNSHLLEPGDSSATVDLPTKKDSWNLVYIILSLRSETTTGGTITYLIRG